MFKVVEAFSGIGSQAKALEKIMGPNEYKILNTIDWDINAIIAYDIIHNGDPDLLKYEKLSKQDLLNKLSKYNLSSDGKKPITELGLKSKSIKLLQHILNAIERSNNLVCIKNVKGKELPNDFDLLTYSFPCQDLSIAHAWFGKTEGIDRNANNRSGLLWEVERILIERHNNGMCMPRFLLMENVSNIKSATHNKNFVEWQSVLKNFGYVNKVYELDASNFGIPQKRTRVYMVSVLCENESRSQEINEYFRIYDLEKKSMYNTINKKNKLEHYLRIDYDNTRYKKEADENCPNDTESRRRIYENSIILCEGDKAKDINSLTITTKQDRLPNAGIIVYDCDAPGKSKYRNLTPRECFLLMGFEESDYDKLIKNDFNIKENKNFFTREKLHRMAGNSIVVDVLEAIFRQILDIDQIYKKDDKCEIVAI